MRRKLSMFMAVGAILTAPAIALAAPPSGSLSQTTATTAPGTTSPPGNGQTNGAGYSHLNSGQAKGQPSQSCQTINGGLTGPFYPGNANSAPGSAFNETGPGTGGTHYAGNVPQSQRNTASVAQYDVACANQAH